MDHYTMLKTRFRLFTNLDFRLKSRDPQKRQVSRVIRFMVLFF